MDLQKEFAAFRKQANLAPNRIANNQQLAIE
jgi:hypothetical protein